MTIELAILGIVTLIVAIGLIPLSRYLGFRTGLIDRPRAGELQRAPIARTGGYAIVGAFGVGAVLSLALIPREDPDERLRLVGFAIGLLIVLVVAIADDRLRLGPMPQLVGQIAAAVVPAGFGLLMFDLSVPWIGLVELPFAIALPVTIVWVVGMMNTVNWLDTMDGLAGGVAAIAALVLFARSIALGQSSVAALPLCVAAACLGFLLFNFHPARVIMGSSGSWFLGYALAMLAIVGGAKVATALMVLGLPIIDTAIVIVQRVAGGRSPFKGGDSAHLVHKLAKRGWGVRQIVLVVYTACAIVGVFGLALSGPVKLAVFGLALVAVTALAILVVVRVRSGRRESAANG